MENVFEKLLTKLDPVLRVPLFFFLELALTNVYPKGNTEIIRHCFVYLLTYAPVLLASFMVFGAPSNKILRFVYGYFICSSIIFILLSVISYLFKGPGGKDIVLGSLNGYVEVLCTKHIWGRKLLLYVVLRYLFAVSRGSYFWIMGCLFYFVTEKVGVHNSLWQALLDVIKCGRLLGTVQAAIFLFKIRKISTVLQVYWLLLLFKTFINLSVHEHFSLPWLLVSMAVTCKSNVSLLAMSLWLPEVSYLLIWISRAFLNMTINHNVMDIEDRGMVKAILFSTIGVINNIPSLELSDRTFMLSILMFISFSDILQCIFTLIDSTLKSFSAFVRTKVSAHIRALSLMLVLLCLLVYTSYKFCTYSAQFHVWQLVVVSSNIVIALQILGSLMIYGLFMYDSAAPLDTVDLDEWVYRITVMINVCEFLIGFFAVQCFTIWNAFKGNWSYTSLIIVALHSYYNIWLRLKDGWHVFLNRREAAIKLKHLTDATQEQLNQLNDVCAICYDAMMTAKITQCGHFFHTNCLRKWLYVQNTCPLCHQDAIKTDNY